MMATERAVSVEAARLCIAACVEVTLGG